MNNFSDISAHSILIEELISVMDTDITHGLNDYEVSNRSKLYGINNITEIINISPFIIFLNQLKSPIVILLAVAAILSFLFKEWLDGSAILVVIIINSIVGFYMEFQAERSMNALKKLSVTPAKVIRNSKLVQINSENIVPGDIVFVEAGDLIPADGRIFKSSQLQSDESALTGESMPVEKHNEQLHIHTTLAERSNMLYKGTFITRGNAHILVTGIGMNTEFGKVAQMIQSAKPQVSPIEIKLEDFGKKLLWVTLGLAILIFVAGLLNGKEIINMLRTSIALAVAAIPEGLPIVATMALAQGMIKLSKQNVIVKKLSAAETLGGTNVICTDKTGTLTKNKIEVKNILCTSEGNMELIKNISIMCNTAELQMKEGELKELGDPLETGLLKYFCKDGKEVIEFRNKFPKIKEEPFSSETKIMATLHKTEGDYIVFAKGAVEKLLSKSKNILINSNEKLIDSDTHDFWINEAEKLASSGMRVIAAAYKKSALNEKDLISDLVFCGLIGMMDPPREDVFEAIKECHSAGINIIMITGDHPSTAKSIASQLNIITDENSDIILGKNMKDFEQLTEEDKKMWAGTHVFARVDPKHKLDLVKVLQEKKFVVGMTGDGINDAPALRKADIGIAMGLRGTQVAQEAADMIIKDDSFSSIVVAIKQGRVIFENIKKFVIFLLSCTLSELFIISIASIFSLYFELFPLQILFINIITDVLPALALGITEGNDRIMKIPPRKESEPIIDRNALWAIIFYSAVITFTNVGAVYLDHYSLHYMEPFNKDLGNNMLFFTLMFSQLFHVLNMGTFGTSFFKSEVFRNKYVWGAIAFSIIIVFIVYFWETTSKILSLHKMLPGDWIISVGAGIVSIIIIQLGKKIKLVKQ